VDYGTDAVKMLWHDFPFIREKFPNLYRNRCQRWQAIGSRKWLWHPRSASARGDLLMPLRVRLIVLVIAALLTSLALGGAVTLINASRSVRTEMLSALQVGRQTIDNAVREIDVSPNPQRDIDDLVASFKGSRHLRVAVAGGIADEEMRPVNDRRPFGKVPAWFVRLIGVAPETDSIPFTIGRQPAGAVVVTTDPGNEILEVWNELSGSLVVLALFAGATIPTIYLLIGHALRPLDRLTGALEQVGHGDYDIRVSDRLTPELARLRDSFNRMAARLAAADADNRRLNKQMLSLQEEERSELARDLHDEIGPFLFAINVDASNMTRLLAEGRTEELLTHTRSIAEVGRHLQRQVRGMLGRLRPISLAEFGLAAAIGGLADFWRRRYPEIDFRVQVARDCEEFGDRIDTTIYRIVQECLSNALRHAEPRMIVISVDRNERSDEVQVEVQDNGTGLSSMPEPGYGLIGMEERVKAIGGRLSFANLTDGGFTVRAVLPCTMRLAEAAR
jgi:two-component system, NarL family, sensor histidine kinase UhpB